MKERIGLIALLLFITLTGFSQNFTWNGQQLFLNNGAVERIITFNPASGSFGTTSLRMMDGKENFIQKPSAEFSFLANGTRWDGFSSWSVANCESVTDSKEGAGVKITLLHADTLQVLLQYVMYPKLPLVRKKVSVTNLGKSEMRLESLNMEELSATFPSTETWIYHSYGRKIHIGPYLGNWDDAVVVLHDHSKRAGMAIGNESPGVLKRTAYNLRQLVTIGLSQPGQDFPFRRWLSPGESWTSPASFIALYSGVDNGQTVLNTTVNDYVRRYMGSRLTEISDKSVFVYNTWYPFRSNISDTLIRSVAEAAAECGVQEFVIDDGWALNIDAKTINNEWGMGMNYGDWQVDRGKFPDDLKATFDYIRSLGMKPGLWLSIGSATANAKVYKDHPEWFVKNFKNKLGNLHYVADSSDFYTTCFGTDWVNYIRDVLLRLVREHGLAYAKLDLSVATSAYVEDLRVSGCYATDHPYHKDHAESFIVIYERLLAMFDELHREAPSLFIDCTFETAGKFHLQDYAVVQHADGNWLSNFENPSPVGPLRVRQMAWWRSPAMPAGSLVVGNLAMDDPDFLFSLKSLIGTLPIVLGDPRKLSPEVRAEIKKWSDWMVFFLITKVVPTYFIFKNIIFNFLFSYIIEK
jgi:alpha-galactosidase